MAMEGRGGPQKTDAGRRGAKRSDRKGQRLGETAVKPATAPNVAFEATGLLPQLLRKEKLTVLGLVLEDGVNPKCSFAVS